MSYYPVSYYPGSSVSTIRSRNRLAVIGIGGASERVSNAPSVTVVRNRRGGMRHGRNGERLEISEKERGRIVEQIRVIVR